MLVVIVGWRWLPYQLLRLEVRGMTPVWGLSGVQARQSGMEAAIQQRGPSAVPQLIRMLDDHDRDIRGAAASALALFPERADLSVPALLRHFREIDDENLANEDP